MLKNKVIKEDLEVNQEDNGIQSFAQLIKLIASFEVENFDTLTQKLSDVNFVEDDDILYNSLPVSVSYVQLPAVVEADVLVKVVKLVQGEGIIITLPDKVADVYKDLIEDPTLIKDKNINLALYAEIYNFNSEDEKLQDIIKSSYLSAGNSAPAFELKDDLAKEEEEQHKEPKGGGRAGTKPTPGGSDDDLGDFGPIAEPVDDMPDITANEEAYKKFKKQGTVLESLSKDLYKQAHEDLRENVKVRYLNENKNILVIEVDNKSVYNKFEHVPIAAKNLLSKFGESIRKNKDTQLVDSFTENGKRYFVVAENLSNNYWVVSNERLSTLKESKTYIEPIQDDIIRLTKSSIRKESRINYPYRRNKRVIYVGGNV
jgi:hypothetical protein